MKLTSDEPTLTDRQWVPGDTLAIKRIMSLVVSPDGRRFALITLCILVGAIYLTTALISPPAPLPIDVPATEFSAGRAMRDLEIIAREPHPMGGSAGHAAVRDYILDEIRAQGLEPQVQEAFGLQAWPGFALGGPVENILVRLPGSDPQGAILLVAHYDSTPGGPGAADNGSGVVLLLELLNNLQASSPLQQDVIFLFSDGEEPGMIGAQAFVDRHPWFDEVSLVVNLDTLITGPPQLRTISGGSGIWVQTLACGTPSTRPGYISFPFDIAPSGGNDLIPFTDAGIRGIYFQPAASASEVHTALDLPAIVDPGSLQQAGDQLVGLVRCLGNRTTLESDLPDQTYFPVLGRLLHYPASWAIPLMVLAGICFLGALIYGFYGKKLTWRGFGLGFLAFLLGLALSLGLAIILWQGIQALHPNYAYILAGGRMTLSGDDIYAFGFFALSLAITTGSIAIVRRKISSLDLAAGALAFWLPAAVVATLLLHVSSYVFTWVLLSGSLALLLALTLAERKIARPVTGLSFLVSAILATFLWIPWISIGVTSGALGGGTLFMGLMVEMAALWIGGLIPALDWIMEPKRRLLPAAAGLAAAGLLVAGHFLVGRDSPPPLVNSIGYWFDADRGDASWIAFVGGTRTDARTYSRTEVAFPEEMDARQTALLVDPVRRPYTDIFPQVPSFSVLTSEAPVLEVDGPRLDVLTDDRVGGRRVIDIRITASIHDRLYIILPDAPLVAITVPGGQRTGLPVNEGWVLRFDGMPVEAVGFRLEFARAEAIQVLLVEEGTGLPDFPGLATRPEPGTMGLPGEFYQGMATDFTAISRVYTLSGSAP